MRIPTGLWIGAAAALVVLALPGRAPGEARILRLGHFPNVTHAQALYARAGGQFEKHLGVPIEWISFNAGPTAIEAMFADAVDATFVGPNPAINGYMKSKGKKFVIVCGGASGGAGLIVRPDAGIATAKDFHDKIIATPQLGNTQDISARTWFAEHGYTLKEKGGDLTLIALANPDQLTLFKKKEIHGAWTIEPWLSRLQMEAGGQLFLDEKTIWPEGRYVTTHLIIDRAFLAANPQLVVKLLEAIVEVTQQINADKRAAVPILNAELKKETGKALPEAVLQTALERVDLTWDPIASSLHRAAAAAHAVGFLRREPELGGIYALEPLNDVLRSKNLPVVTE